MRPLLACLLLALSLPAAAEIYSYTDANGNKVFTNEPPQGSNAELVQLPPTNSVAAQPTTTNNNATPNSSSTDAPFSVLQLTNLPTDEAMRANNGTFSVGVNSVPHLAASQQVQLVLDGQPYGAVSSNPPLQLSNIERGDHTLAVQVLSGGRVVQQSDAVTFSVQRVNTSSPALRPKPVPPPTPKPKPTPKPAG
ncbi:MAG: DUF4124 domain-containing protein [Pseudomonas sp.]|uniref:DUF4124 domain-containing protein n=1 Tax=Pseudomonas sp. TaxID=306 RepID=UPI0027362D6E|nr:DUF4124 domain-containing protein [Pseudomonas sp.]MDP3845769.1 DUF4124 domain-containing protein [Pseudomonas sp.]